MATQPNSTPRRVECPVQMSFDWEFPPAIQNPTDQDETARCRWEDDGGAIGSEDSHGD
jgi:hypothetical protein